MRGKNVAFPCWRAVSQANLLATPIKITCVVALTSYIATAGFVPRGVRKWLVRALPARCALKVLFVATIFSSISPDASSIFRREIEYFLFLLVAVLAACPRASCTASFAFFNVMAGRPVCSVVGRLVTGFRYRKRLITIAIDRVRES